MVRYLLLIFLVSNICCKLFAQKIDTIKGECFIQAHKLPYTLLKIGCDSNNSVKVPIVLFLHGAGERGDKNKEQLTVGLPVLINSIIAAKNYPCILIVPQCPVNQKWVDTDWTKKSHLMALNMAWPLNGAVQLLDSLVRNNLFIDTNRVYLTGISMGGFGTWELVQRFPKKFAAVIPICGGGDTSRAKSIVNTPIWAFHGRKDKLVPVSRTLDMIKAINNSKLAKCTIIEKEGHLCWNTTYKNSALIKWLFSQVLYAK
jgi:predicted peptidase